MSSFNKVIKDLNDVFWEKLTNETDLTINILKSLVDSHKDDGEILNGGSSAQQYWRVPFD